MISNLFAILPDLLGSKLLRGFSNAFDLFRNTYINLFILNLREFPYNMAYHPSHQQNRIYHSPLHLVPNTYCFCLIENYEHFKRTGEIMTKKLSIDSKLSILFPLIKCFKESRKSIVCCSRTVTYIGRSSWLFSCSGWFATSVFTQQLNVVFNVPLFSFLQQTKSNILSI